MSRLQVRQLDALSSVPARQWDALHDGANPFVAHAFLEGLEPRMPLRAQGRCADAGPWSDGSTRCWDRWSIWDNAWPD